MSRPELADAVNVALDQLFPGRNTAALYVDARWVGKLERGEHRWPNDERRAGLRHVLGADTDAELGLHSPRRTDGLHHPDAALEPPIGPGSIRAYGDRSGGPEAPRRRNGQQAALAAEARRVLEIRTAVALCASDDCTTGMAASSVLRPGVSEIACDPMYVELGRSIIEAARQTSEHAMYAGAWAVSEATIDQLRDDTCRVARAVGDLPPAVAVQETLRLRDLAVGLLERTRRPGQQRELYLVVAQSAALLASGSADLGLWRSTMEYARAALTYGEVIGHAGVRAYALGMQAVAAYWTGRPDDAVRYAQQAVDAAPVGTASVRARCILARAWAHRGSVAADRIRSAFAAAADARADDGADELHDVVGGEFGFTAAQQARCESTAWLQAGHPDAAVEPARRSLELVGRSPAGSWPTIGAEARVDLATCYVLAGQLDAADETLAALWSIPADWRRVGLLGRMNRIRNELADQRWRSVAVAGRIADRATSFGAEVPARMALPPA